MYLQPLFRALVGPDDFVSNSWATDVVSSAAAAISRPNTFIVVVDESLGLMIREKSDMHQLLNRVGRLKA